VGKRHGHGDGSIYRRKSDDRHPAVVALGYVNGTRQCKVIYGTTRKEVAEKLMAQLCTQVAPGSPLPTFIA
jgi:hypothetical protein